MRSVAEVIWGAIFGFFVGLAITAAFVYYETHYPDPHDPQKGASSPIVGFIIVPFCTSAGILRAVLKASDSRDEE